MEGTQSDSSSGTAAILVATETDAFESAVASALPSGYRIMRASSARRAVELAGAGIDVAVIDAALQPSLTIPLIHDLRAELGGFTIVCSTDASVRMRAETITELRAVECTDVSLPSGEFAAQVERLASIRAHRRELEECEQGERDCTLRQPRLKRGFTGRRRLMLIIAAAVVLITAIAVPIVVLSLRAAHKSVQSGVDATNDMMDRFNRIEGYLQRDEERKIQRDR